MAKFKKRGVDDDEETGLVYRRSRKLEADVERKTGGCRFPALPDGSPALGFATLSHSNLKSWAKLAKAQGHNTRAIETPNARKDAKEPIELLTEVSGTYAERVKAVLEAHGVPVKIRKNGTIATEDIFGASPEYWNRTGDWKKKPIEEIIHDPVVQAALALARKTHGKRLISCSLHVDEESPHLHVVAVPLVKRLHAKRGRKPKGCPVDHKGMPIDPRPPSEKWSLDVSSTRGLSSQLEQNHDEWAQACVSMGLVRGERGSEMTEEERRARRNRQTGRANMAEKVAREERETLLHDAKAKAAQLVADAHAEASKVKTEATEAYNQKVEHAAALARAIDEGVQRIKREADEDRDQARQLQADAEQAIKDARAIKADAERLKADQAERELELQRDYEDVKLKRAAAADALAKARRLTREDEARRAQLADNIAAVTIGLKPES